MNGKNMNNLTQFAIPTITISAQLAIALKHPELGLVLNLGAQPFWLYSAWKSWKNAGQIGLFVTTVIFTLVTLGGILNYWLIE